MPKIVNYFSITKKDKILKGTIHLPSSKSESNRALIIRALCGKLFKIKNLSEADDTRVLKNILEVGSRKPELPPTNYPPEDGFVHLANQLPITHNVGAAGTTMRFLTSFFSVQPGKEVILTGTQRMKARPVKILADALMELGADIEYPEKPGFPPLKIKGKKLAGSKTRVDGSISSQYISSLLMIAPVLENGLEIKFEGEVISKPYIDMTLKIMEHFGIKYKARKNSICVKNQQYHPKDFTVESDWSAASYWYEMAAFSDEADITLAGLKKESLQGDSIVEKLFEQFGVKTTYLKNGIHLKKSAIRNPQYAICNFSNYPDLAQTVAVTCAGLGIAAHFTGLKTLRIKETDRVKALQNELINAGIKTEIPEDNEIKILKSPFSVPQSPISTYEDHRMAMSFAPLAMISGEIKIENPEVVKKSYPGFWKDLKSVGFEIMSS